MKKIFSLFCAVLLMLSIMLSSSSVLTFAHEHVLEIDYDECDPELNEYGDVISNFDGEDEMWYYTKRPVFDFCGIVYCY